RKILKLSSRFYGPFKILQRVGPIAYKLELPDGSRIHPVFHVSLLKKKIGKEVAVQTTLPALQYEDDSLMPSPQQAILDQRMKQRHFEILVHWHRLSPAEATWENLEEFNMRY
ncbi:Chromo domain-containing protein, partial [Cephalotus follicularis]